MKNAKHFWGLLTTVSRLKYVLWRLLGGPKPITIDLQSGLRLELRELATTDYGVAWDIYWRGCYRSPKPLSSVNRIVDLGANVGYSCLWWCHEYPNAQVIAFEPHPIHVKSIKRHLATNGLESRVDLIEAAAGVAKGMAYLTDAGSSSAVTDNKLGHPIRVADLFQTAVGPIDILKVDIEGGEYALLADKRFPLLRARVVVVEWHRKPGRDWCIERLQSMGYEIQIGIEDHSLAGLIWAYGK